jgi:hypothetical protein
MARALGERRVLEPIRSAILGPYCLIDHVPAPQATGVVTGHATNVTFQHGEIVRVKLIAQPRRLRSFPH